MPPTSKVCRRHCNWFTLHFGTSLGQNGVVAFATRDGHTTWTVASYGPTERDARMRLMDWLDEHHTPYELD